MLAWAKAIGEFGATIMVAGTMAFRTETLPVAIFMRLSSADIEGTVALIIVLLAIGLGAFYAVPLRERRAELDAVCAQAGTFRLKDISLTVAEGESHVLLGPSGAGKTTLLEVIIGFRRPETGGCEFAGRPRCAPHRAAGHRVMPQRLDLFPHLTVYENILRTGPGPCTAARRVQPGNALVAATGIRALLAGRRPPLRRGTPARRPVRALAAKPPLLLLDEPFAALNESLRRVSGGC